MKPKITPELLHKYLDGECTPQEFFLLHQWYDAFEGNHDPMAVLNQQEQEALRKLMFDNFKASITVADVNEAEPVPKKFTSLKWIIAGMAAAVLLICGAFFISQQNSQQVSIVSNESIVLSNRTNTIHRQLLSDGSVVWLNPKSSLQYPNKFVGAYRKVKMTGEAFFEVKKDHAHPFIIYSGGVETRVWGTSFRIRAIHNIPTEVSVVTGKVSVKIPEKKNSEVMLLPTEKATFFEQNLSLTKSSEHNSSMKRWQKTSLSFDNVPLQSVFNKLNNHYGVRIYTSDNQIGRYLLKADFTDQSLPAILDMIQTSLNVTYVLDNEEIVIYKNNNTEK